MHAREVPIAARVVTRREWAVPVRCARKRAACGGILFGAGALLASLAACAAPRAVVPPRFEFSRLAMGVEARIVLHAPSEPDARAAAEAAFDTIARLDLVLSDWTATSAVSHLCAHAGQGAVAVPHELFEVLETSLELSRATEGAFDPTVGPLVALWRRARTLGRMPDPAEIERARERVGVHLVVLDREGRTVELARAGMQLDFGAIGKGLACQRAVETLAAQGIQSGLVQMGGDIVCSDPPPGARGWSVEVGEGAPRERILLAHHALSISGDAEQHLVIDGMRRSHVLDPRADLGLEQGVRAIVVAPDGATADALATAAGVLGPERGVTLIARMRGCEARIESGLPAPTRRETVGFARLERDFAEVP